MRHHAFINCIIVLTFGRWFVCCVRSASKQRVVLHRRSWKLGELQAARVAAIALRDAPLAAGSAET